VHVPQQLRRAIDVAGASLRSRVGARAEEQRSGPDEMRLSALIAEDFATYDGNLLAPGLWAVVAHRFGRRADRTPSGVTRLALGGAHVALSRGVDLVWGIKIPRPVALGRRVHLWHNGCMLLDANSIGNDVHIRHDTTFGAVRGRPTTRDELPTIEDGVELGSGVCVLGAVRVGQNSVVGANSVVLRDVPSGATVMGVPARVIPT